MDIETRDINRHITHTAIIIPHISLLAAGAVLLSSAGQFKQLPPASVSLQVCQPSVVVLRHWDLPGEVC